LARLDQFYLGNGWYQDGASGAPFRDGHYGDYYVPMAFHFYSLLYARVAGDSDPARSARFLERARLFAQDFIHYFAADGSALPFGRSLTYRFAQGAFWGGLAFAPIEALPWPVIKGLYLRHLRWWICQPIFSETGLLTIGYAYPNLLMAESYNSSGSPYWGMKAFIPLSLPADHPFWRAEEAPLPARRAVHSISGARLVAVTDPRSRDVTALNPGQEVEDWPRHAPQKYSKFAYSTRFGFCVPASSATPMEGGFDNMLALSDDNRRYRVREHAYDSALQDGVAYSRWTPWPDVTVRTWLIAGHTFHVRIHRIESPRQLWSYEGGFAAPYIVRTTLTTQVPSGAVPAWSAVSTPWGQSWMRDLFGLRVAETVELGANSHVLASLSAMPALKNNHPAGEFWLAALAGGGAPDSTKNNSADAPEPDFTIETSGAICRVLRNGVEWWTSEGGVCGRSSAERLQSLQKLV
jgi:hypothetical protein